MNKRFFDLRTNLDVHPVSGDLIRLVDDQAITGEIKNLIFTAMYERFWDPELGAGIPQTLFDNFGADSEYAIKNIIRETINKYVSRANLLDVVVKYDNHNGYNVTIVYQPINTLQPLTINMILKRTR